MILRVKKLLMVLLAGVLALSMGVAIAMNMPMVKADGEATLSISMEKGLSVRTEDPIGIRFRTYVNKAYVDANQNDIEIVVMITPTRNIGDKTFEADFGGDNDKIVKKIVFSKENGNLVDGILNNEEYKVPCDETNYWYHACIVDLDDKNIARDFSARSYVLYKGVLVENSYTNIAQGNAWNSAKEYLEDDTVIKTETDIANAQALCASNIATITGFDGETYPVTVKRGQTVAQALEGVDLAKELNVDGAAYYKGIVEDTNVTLTEDATFTAKMNALQFTKMSNGNGYAVIDTTITAEDTSVIKVPNKYNGESVTTVGRKAFATERVGYPGEYLPNTDITKVYLPESVTTILGSAFKSCVSLVYVEARGWTSAPYNNTAPDGSTVSCDNIFSECTSLKTIILGESFDYSANAEIFCTDNEQEKGILDIYLSSLNGILKKSSGYKHNLLSGNVYNYDNEEPYTCGTWHFTDATETEVELAPTHEFENGACKICDADQTKGIIYTYDATLNGGKGGYMVYNDNNSNGSNPDSAYTGSDKEVYVRAYYDDGIHNRLPVTALGRRAFRNETEITRVILPSTVTTFLKGATFNGCSKLEYVDARGITNLNDNGTNGDGHFNGCVSLETVIFGANFTAKNNSNIFNADTAPEKPILNIYLYSANGTFEVSANTDLFANNLLSRKVYCYDENGTCGTWKFNEDESDIIVALDHEYEGGACKNCDADQTAGLMYVYDASLDDGKGAYMVRNEADDSAYNGTDTVVYVRAYYDDGVHDRLPVRALGRRAFRNESTITHVILPDTVTGIYGVAFYGCTSLKYVQAPGVTKCDYATYQDGQFKNCTSLEVVIFGDSFSIHGNVGVFSCDTAVTNPKCHIYLSSADGEFIKGNNTTEQPLLSTTETVYYYSEEQPTDTSKTYWHYDETTGLAVLWN
ncbi:MAG: hypothetical protein E7373_05410 [Clostridiales bacterium]|nr:hypothetical protein [Clostridiales bacterium]